ncbi:MAG: AtpZ/AtpI family protein [Thermodesulfovibrionales bacterium]|nr:AtpZ/AtpI family protein [Thermodesulfovibrionales bacterium]
MSEKKNEGSPLKQLLIASAVGLQLVFATFIGFAIGYGLDSLLGTDFLKWIFLVFGLIAGFRELFRFVRK